jgi:hypothetical protein
MLMVLNVVGCPPQREPWVFTSVTWGEYLTFNACHLMFLGVFWIVDDIVNPRKWNFIPWFVHFILGHIHLLILWLRGSAANYTPK